MWDLQDVSLGTEVKGSLFRAFRWGTVSSQQNGGKVPQEEGTIEDPWPCACLPVRRYREQECRLFLHSRLLNLGMRGPRLFHFLLIS